MCSTSYLPPGFSEAERYLPSLITLLEKSLKNYGIAERRNRYPDDRMPKWLRKAISRRNRTYRQIRWILQLYLGGSFDGTRLNSLYKETLSEKEILEELDYLFKDYAANRNEHEKLGDFVIRNNYVAEIKEGKEFQH
jgi:sulfite reductase (NADPH) hemoprotein beta-component